MQQLMEVESKEVASHSMTLITRSEKIEQRTKSPKLEGIEDENLKLRIGTTNRI